LVLDVRKQNVPAESGLQWFKLLESLLALFWGGEAHVAPCSSLVGFREHALHLPVRVQLLEECLKFFVEFGVSSLSWLDQALNIEHVRVIGNKWLEALCLNVFLELLVLVKQVFNLVNLPPDIKVEIGPSIWQFLAFVFGVLGDDDLIESVFRVNSHDSLDFLLEIFVVEILLTDLLKDFVAARSVLVISGLEQDLGVIIIGPEGQL
jgi:hypothetical protein